MSLCTGLARGALPSFEIDPAWARLLPEESCATRATPNDKHPMAVKRALIHVLLAFALLLGQQAMLAHGATHLAKPPASQDKQLPEHKVCEQCALSVQFGSALIGKPLSFAVQRQAVQPAPHSTQFVPAATPRAFHSRAPPASL